MRAILTRAQSCMTEVGTSMRVLRWLGVVVALFAASQLAISGALPASVDGHSLPTLAPMLERVMPAVVNIATRSQVVVRQHPLRADPFFQRFFGAPLGERKRELQSLGSGVIVDATQGFIVTNEHVIRDATEITVSLHDGRSLDATLIGADSNTDIAIIQVAAEDLTSMVFADSEVLRVGDFVVAIGNPFGLGQSATSGIVSALGRSGLGIEDYEDFIQTDASINTGNSGGALVNLRGELVGINTAILAPSGGNVGIGFAIPSNMAGDVMGQLLTYGKVRRGLLGVAMRDVTPAVAQAFGLGVTNGAVVVRVQVGSPATHAGVRAGDVIVAINDERIASTSDAHNALGLMQVGEAVRLEVLRDGQRITLEANLAERVEESVAVTTFYDRLAGAMLADIDVGSPFYGRIEGVIIAQVQPGSPAEGTGVREGDVITAANRERVRTLSDFAQILARSGRTLQLRLRRGPRAVLLLVQ